MLCQMCSKMGVSTIVDRPDHAGRIYVCGVCLETLHKIMPLLKVEISEKEMVEDYDWFGGCVITVQTTRTNSAIRLVISGAEPFSGFGLVDHGDNGPTVLEYIFKLVSKKEQLASDEFEDDYEYQEPLSPAFLLEKILDYAAVRSSY